MDQREVVLYTRRHSLGCWRAERFLRHQGCNFEVLNTEDDPRLAAELSEALHHEVAPPYVLVDHRPVGDFGLVKALCRSGEFHHLIRDEI
jgi:hypothetical protein